MTLDTSIEIIYKVAKLKMKEGEAGNYVGEVVSFCLNRLSEHENFSKENLEALLAEEAEFHQNCLSKDVA